MEIGKSCPQFNNHYVKTPLVFPGSHNSGQNRPANSANPTKAELSKKNCGTVSEALGIQYLVRAQNGHKSPGSGGLSSKNGGGRRTSVEGNSNSKGSGAGIILEKEGEIVVKLSIKFDFPASNNKAEYEVLIAGLKLANDVGTSPPNDLQRLPDHDLTNI